ncbi:hypothetical protein [Azospirillum isscasi]|uniref:Uncharacterized protein n=1 Tax=Azospirillum isscasi TaxID=3053926 RepID=A0ABU0WFR6_9PROT|nr:hypothetical protein [Azospirillum isscasi]MDQ2103036.1 hypothetical protein [Azospirillum isscasi]
MLQSNLSIMSRGRPNDDHGRARCHELPLACAQAANAGDAIDLRRFHNRSSGYYFSLHAEILWIGAVDHRSAGCVGIRILHASRLGKDHANLLRCGLAARADRILVKAARTPPDGVVASERTWRDLPDDPYRAKLEAGHDPAGARRTGKAVGTVDEWIGLMKTRRKTGELNFAAPGAVLSGPGKCPEKWEDA